MSPNPVQKHSNFLGYELQDRIGAGGYGEVWSAVAPGGLRKAIKFVFGYHDEKRAQAELKALDRVKELRHPFLLSLERIDIHDGQLVIVSELADGCLADEFNEFLKKGEPGIPRDQLLTYIRDAADALDYLSDTHSLQHLDIKPENLLIVAGHVKVADFGLVKDLNVASQSLMTGMTPAYAAPELFDGKPGQCSDQYSLAIVYQEMLTGIRPFPGSTPAQLAAQHMHGRPNLRPLPKSDQPIIAKALSKDPNVRFDSCREMVDELLNRKLRKRTIRRIERPEPKESTETNTIQIGDATQGRDVTAVVSQDKLPFQSSEIVNENPPECDASEASFRPTIVIAVGNTASQTCKKLKQRLVARHGSMNEIPSVKLMCIDSDRQSLGELSSSRSNSGFTENEIVTTPLFKPEVYRDRASSHLAWLSRRWIYNIPRTLQTEGLRPLGRLAFADHFEPICRSVERNLTEIIREENIAQTSDRLGLDPAKSKQPRVFIVSSISGGIAGMTLDLAYTVKSLMIEHGLTSDSITGVLLNATNRRSREAGLSAANSFTFFTEMRHYTDFGYPGDATIGLPEFQDEPPIDSAYYLDLGLDLKQTDFEEKLDSIAEWIYLNSLSTCSVFFDKCRDVNSESEHFDLRTFGLSICGPGKQVSGSNQVDELTQDLLQQWLNGKGESQDIETVVETLFREQDLHADGIANFVDELVQQEISDDSFHQFYVESEKIVSGNERGFSEALTKYYDSVFGCPASQKEVGFVDPKLCHTIEELIGREAIQIGEHLSETVLQCLESEQLDLAKPVTLVNTITDQLGQIKEQLDTSSKACAQQLEELYSLMQTMLGKKAQLENFESSFQNCLESIRQFRWQEFVVRQAKGYCQVVRSCVKSIESLLNKHRTEIGYIARRFESETGDRSMGSYSDVFDMEQAIIDTIDRSRQDLIDRTETQLYQDLVEPAGGYSAMLNENACVQNTLPQAIREAAVQILADAYKKISIDDIVAENQLSVEKLMAWLNGMLNNARPDVSDCGGAVRLLMGFPQFADESRLPDIVAKEFSVIPAYLKGTAGDLVVCFEGEKVALPNVAFRLLEHRPDAAELARRIHTRSDIDWSSLEDLL